MYNDGQAVIVHAFTDVKEAGLYLFYLFASTHKVKREPGALAVPSYEISTVVRRHRSSIERTFLALTFQRSCNLLPMWISVRRLAHLPNRSSGPCLFGGECRTGGPLPSDLLTPPLFDSSPSSTWRCFCTPSLPSAITSVCLSGKQHPSASLLSVVLARSLQNTLLFRVFGLRNSSSIKAQSRQHAYRWNCHRRCPAAGQQRLSRRLRPPNTAARRV